MYKYGWYDYGTSYSYGGSSNWWWGGSVTEWASKWTYVKPDYQKIKDALLVEQKKMNAKGIPIKISYGVPSVMRKKHGVSRVVLDEVKHIRKLNVFLEKTRAMWIVELGSSDSRVFLSLLERWSGWEVDGVSSRDWSIMDNKETYLKIRWAVKDKEWKENPNATTWWWSSAFQLIPIDLQACMQIWQSIKNKIKIPDMIRLKEQSTRKWQRINRNFVNQTSYKPLQNQYDYKVKPKTALAVLDSSGSMCGDIHINAQNFMEWLKMSGIFTTNCYYSSNYCIYKSDQKNALRASWSEGFEHLLQRLEIAWEDYSGYDYIFVFTDLNIGINELNELNTMLKGKKHILFNFNRSGDVNSYKESYPDLKIIQSFEVNAMIQTLINYV